MQGRTCWSGGVAGLFIEVAIEGVNGGAIVQGENVYGDSSVVFGACAFCQEFGGTEPCLGDGKHILTEETELFRG